MTAREPRLEAGRGGPGRGRAGGEGGEATLVVPLVSRDEIVGVLDVSPRAGCDGLDDFQLRGIAMFGEAAASAIANARTYARSEERIRTLTELDELKTEFLALVTHELRTPLSSIIGIAATLAQNADRLTTQQVRRLAETSRGQGWRLERLVNDLLQSAEAQKGTLRLRGDDRDVAGLLREVVAALEPVTGDHELCLEVPEVPVVRRVDADAIDRIVTNLVTNAVKYTPAGTKILVVLEAAAGGVLLSVTDHGPGIPPGERAEMFSKFRRGSMVAHTSGLGLGLYIVRSLAEAHGGEAMLREAPAGGCEFVVRLASLREPAPAVATAAAR